jgi:hypothetical protein
MKTQYIKLAHLRAVWALVEAGFEVTAIDSEVSRYS